MSNPRVWKLGNSKEITFIVTKDCQLSCKYCYQVGKNSRERMSWETAKKAVDYFIENEHDELFDYESVVFSFIGGEPFLEIALIDRICDYIKMQLYLRNHHWFDSYRFAITTNGINYDNPDVQRFIKKNLKHLSITLTIDGTQRKHDMNRVWKNRKDGKAKGSYQDVVRNIPLWLHQFPHAATKVTISSEDLPFVCESVRHIYSLGIENIYITCVNENVWKEGDDAIFENQLLSLADYIIDNDLYDSNYCSFFDRSIGHPFSAEYNWNWCGTGVTLAVDASGSMYPCTRFAKFSLRDKEPRTIGDLDNGVDANLLRPFESLRRDVQSTIECFECDVATGCAWCQAENYDCADTPTIFQRSTAICKMHKARVRANNYYWKKLDQLLGNHTTASIPEVDSKCRLDKTVESPENIVVLLSDESTPFCVLSNIKGENAIMPIAYLNAIIDKAKTEGRHLEFVYPKAPLPEEYTNLINSVPHTAIIPVNSAYGQGDVIVVNGWSEIPLIGHPDAFYVFRTSLDEFCHNIDGLLPLLKLASRLNIVFTDEYAFSQSDLLLYEDAIHELKELVLIEWEKGRQTKVNLITERLFLDEMCNCDAGWKSVTLAPNGSFYICPSFYYDNPADKCGDIINGLDIKNLLLYKLNHSPICRDCNAYHCNRCVFISKKKTLEVNTPSFEQCEKSRIELETTKSFYDLWNAQKMLP